MTRFIFEQRHQKIAEIFLLELGDRRQHQRGIEDGRPIVRLSKILAQHALEAFNKLFAKQVDDRPVFRPVLEQRVE